MYTLAVRENSEGFSDHPLFIRLRIDAGGTFDSKKRKELKEVLDILKKDESLLEIFEKAKMHINPNSTFWVSDTASHLLFLKEPQYYDANFGLLTAASDNEPHYRLTIAYFYKSNVSW